MRCFGAFAASLRVTPRIHLSLPVALAFVDSLQIEVPSATQPARTLHIYSPPFSKCRIWLDECALDKVSGRRKGGRAEGGSRRGLLGDSRCGLLSAWTAHVCAVLTVRALSVRSGGRRSWCSTVPRILSHVARDLTRTCISTRYSASRRSQRNRNFIFQHHSNPSPPARILLPVLQPLRPTVTYFSEYGQIVKYEEETSALCGR